MTSAVTWMPRAFAQRTTSTEPAVDTWQTCSRAPTCCGEQDIPGDDRLLGDRRPAGQPELAGQLALVHLGALGEPRLLRVLRDHSAEGLDVLERAAHQQGIRARSGRRRRRRAPAPRSPPWRRSRLSRSPREADGDRTDRAHVDVAGLRAQPPDLLDHAGRVGDRVGVGHRVHGGEAARRPRPGAGQRPSRCPRGRARAGGCAGRRGRAERPGRRASIDAGAAGLGRRRSSTNDRRRSIRPGRRMCRPGSVDARAQDVSARASVVRAPLRPTRGQQQVEHGHPYRDPVGDLFEHGRSSASRQRRRRSPGRGPSARGASPSYPDAAAASRSSSRPHSREYSRAFGKNAAFIRSRWMRSIITTSALRHDAASRSYPTSTGQVSTPDGSSVGGATRVTWRRAW